MAYSLPVTSVSSIRRLLDEARASGREITPGLARKAAAPYIQEETQRLMEQSDKRRRIANLAAETALSEQRAEVASIQGRTELSRLKMQGEQMERERADATVKGGIEMAKLGVTVYPKLKAMLAGGAAKGIPVPATSVPMSTATPYAAGGLEWPITSSIVPEAAIGASTGSGAGVTGASTGIVAGTEAGAMLPSTAIPMAGAILPEVGAEAGVAAGAAAGSALPVIGTILGGIVVGGLLNMLMRR